ncbi:unnamed protein product [Spirodela intermedia]|uniref:Uncharacterized protein n=1 Tax=Spirodela intermedia TaxID=51605 RepID=A0A7I8IW97_SPIIN|nr:unnamed protein product [Spirodela intermedia]CAA6661933.1 unnamed protein product [Spirodela intermedia]
MADSAFKSTSRRGASQGPPPRLAPRGSGARRRIRREDTPPPPPPGVGGGVPEQEDNPLFCSTASPTVLEDESGDDDDGGGSSKCRRGRSSSRSSAFIRKEWGGRSLSRVDAGRRRRSGPRGRFEDSELGNTTLGDRDLHCRRRAGSVQESQFKRRKDPSIMSCENLEGKLSNLQVSNWDDGSRSDEHPSNDSGHGSMTDGPSQRSEAAVARRDSSMAASGVDSLSEPATYVRREFALELQQASVEWQKMSRQLTEEAMSYFDECVSISTFDASDFSSPEDQVLSSVDDNLTRDDDRPNPRNTQRDLIGHPEGDPSQSRASQSSFSRRSTGSGGAHNLKYYITRFRKGLHSEGDDHSNSRSKMFLLEKAALRNRVESGCLIQWVTARQKANVDINNNHILDLPCCTKLLMISHDIENLINLKIL